jgi:hypothetical protein
MIERRRCGCDAAVLYRTKGEWPHAFATCNLQSRHYSYRSQWVAATGCREKRAAAGVAL